MDISNKEGLKIMQEVAQETAHRVVNEFKTELKEEIIPEVVKETMSNLGQDVSDKQEAQKDYHYLRKRRLRSERVEEWKMKGIVTAAVSTVVAAVIAYFKNGS